MDVVRHERVRVYSATVLLTRRAKAGVKKAIVSVDGEYHRAIVAALDDVLGDPGAGVAWEASQDTLVRTENRADEPLGGRASP